MVFQYWRANNSPAVYSLCLLVPNLSAVSDVFIVDEMSICSAGLNAQTAGVPDLTQ